MRRPRFLWATGGRRTLRVARSAAPGNLEDGRWHMARRIAALTSGLVLLALLMLHGPEVTRPAFAGSDSFALATSITTPQYSGIVATADTTGAPTEGVQLLHQKMP